MADEFRRRRGYDLQRFLPAVTGRVVDSLEISERFLWDLRKTIAELITENYAGRMRDLAHRHGLQLSIEPYGVGLMDNFSYAGMADVPMCEYWTAGDETGNRAIKTVSSAAHVYGKPVCGAESFTSQGQFARWTDHPLAMKALGDVAFCDGVNRFVIHRYALQPWLDRQPGMTMGNVGVHYERTETWWPYVGPWHEYLARCNHLLRQGLFVADVCCLQTEDVPSCPGYQPNIAGLPSNDRDDPPGVRPPKYDYDGCSPEVVLTRMRVEHGRIVLSDGMSYRLMVLPPGETMTPGLLGKIKELVEAGATVVGPRPVRSPSLSGYPACDRRVERLAAELWGDCDGKTVTEHRLGRGRIVCGKTPEMVLAEMGVPPDFQCPSFTGAIRYIHRAVGETDVYFVANAAPQAIGARCTFRVHGKCPEFWHPDTGRIEPAAVYDQDSRATEIPISIDPCGSLFVVFRPDAAAGEPDRVTGLSRNGRPVLPGSSGQPGSSAAQIAVQRATYGVPGDPKRSRDVTEKVRRLVQRGIQGFWVEYAMPGNLAPDAMKTLTVDYTVDGRPQTARATDKELILLAGESERPAARAFRGPDGRLWIEARAAGRYQVKTASEGSVAVEVAALPEPIDVPGPWELRFPDGWARRRG